MINWHENEAFRWLLAKAKELHKADHDAAPEGCCPRCIDRELRLKIQDAKGKLTEEQFRHLRWSLGVELKGESA